MHRLRLYGISETKALAQVLDGLAEIWSREWLGAEGSPGSTIHVPECAVTESRPKWRRLSREGRVVAYSVSAGFSKRIAAEAGWCDSAATKKASTVWDNTINDCLDAFAGDILAAATNEGFQVSPDAGASVESDGETIWYSPASGYLSYSVTVGPESVTFVLDPAIVSALLGTPPRVSAAGTLTGRSSAIANGICTLELVAGTAEVTVGELHTLSEGHVIQLDNLVGQPFKLRTTEGREIGDGYLAACGANKAVHVIQR